MKNIVNCFENNQINFKCYHRKPCFEPGTQPLNCCLFFVSLATLSVGQIPLVVRVWTYISNFECREEDKEDEEKVSPGVEILVFFTLSEK